MSQLLKSALKDRGHEITGLTPISDRHGSSVWRLALNDNDAIFKVGPSENINAEAWGLRKLTAVSGVWAPAVIDHWHKGGEGFLIMEYVPSRGAVEQDMKALGKMLAALHTHRYSQFGTEHNNFIGSLRQDNTIMSSWADFWWERRISPQLDLASKGGFKLLDAFPDLEKKIRASTIVRKVQQASLLHGDLWDGNFMIHQDGRPFFIDPCPYFGDPRVDLAMTRLFGGFSPSFYGAYVESANHDLQFNDEVSNFYQLYFLLNHLNMFGSGYLGRVKTCLSSIC